MQYRVRRLVTIGGKISFLAILQKSETLHVYYQLLMPLMQSASADPKGQRTI